MGNASFLAIPVNAANPAGAMVVADLALSPEQQLAKADPEVWGKQMDGGLRPAGVLGNALRRSVVTRPMRIFDKQRGWPGASAAVRERHCARLMSPRWPMRR